MSREPPNEFSGAGVTIRLVVALLLISVGGCATESGSEGRTEVSVFAASSLTDAFIALEPAFEEAHPDLDVVVSFAGSQVLRLQIEQGAQAHVFASADEDHARALEEGGFAAEAELLAHNRLAIIVPPDNPAGIESLADLPSASRLVVASDRVPLGRYTRHMLEQAGGGSERVMQGGGRGFADSVRAAVVSEENNARLVRAKVELGEADAAIVYLTDALSSNRVRTIHLPGPLDLPTRYVIAPLRESDGTVDELGARFVRFAQSERGQALLREYGFMTEADEGEGR